MLDVGRRVQSLINEDKGATEIAHAGRLEGMETLRDGALRKLAEGITPVEEVIRVTADAG